MDYLRGRVERERRPRRRERGGSGAYALTLLSEYERGEGSAFAMAGAVGEVAKEVGDGFGEQGDLDGAFDGRAKRVNPELLQSPVADGTRGGASSPRGKEQAGAGRGRR